jgi:2-dehydro-3-deoxygluconokinase
MQVGLTELLLISVYINIIMKKVFCFGELLLRMSPQLNRQWIKQASMQTYIGGAELNVATALAKWNVPVKYCTALPDNYLSKEIMDELQSKNIDTSAVHLSGNRIGTYYMPPGADLKNASVIYDRDHSSFSYLKPGMLNWDEILEDCGWFHFTAISPALNENIAAVCKEGLEVATEKGLTISVDLNYRQKLWQYGKAPAAVMPPLVQYCNVLMGNIWSAEILLGLQSDLKESAGKSDAALIEEAGKSMKQIHLAHPKITTMAYTFRLAQTYFGVLQHGTERVISKTHSLHSVIDKAGSGDCFMGGLIYGLYNQHQPQQIIEFASAAAVGKMREGGDTTSQTIADVLKTTTQNG